MLSKPALTLFGFLAGFTVAANTENLMSYIAPVWHWERAVQRYEIAAEHAGIQAGLLAAEIRLARRGGDEEWARELALWAEDERTKARANTQARDQAQALLSRLRAP